MKRLRMIVPLSLPRHFGARRALRRRFAAEPEFGADYAEGRWTLARSVGERIECSPALHSFAWPVLRLAFPARRRARAEVEPIQGEYAMSQCVRQCENVAPIVG